MCQESPKETWTCELKKHTSPYDPLDPLQIWTNMLEIAGISFTSSPHSDWHALKDDGNETLRL